MRQFIEFDYLIFFSLEFSIMDSRPISQPVSMEKLKTKLKLAGTTITPIPKPGGFAPDPRSSRVVSVMPTPRANQFRYTCDTVRQNCSGPTQNIFIFNNFTQPGKYKIKMTINEDMLQISVPQSQKRNQNQTNKWLCGTRIIIVIIAIPVIHSRYIVLWLLIIF